MTSSPGPAAAPPYLDVCWPVWSRGARALRLLGLRRAAARRRRYRGRPDDDQGDVPRRPRPRAPVRVKVNDVTVGKVKTVNLKGYVAEVSARGAQGRRAPRQRPRRDPADQPARREVRPAREPTEPGTGKLSNDDVIGLDRTGRNPEVEEVLGALSLLLNGGGSASSDHLRRAQQRLRGPRARGPLGARPRSAASWASWTRTRTSIVAAIENANRLALEIRRGRRDQGTLSTTSRTHCGRWTASAPTWSSCSRRFSGSAVSACG